MAERTPAAIAGDTVGVDGYGFRLHPCRAVIHFAFAAVGHHHAFHPPIQVLQRHPFATVQTREIYRLAGVDAIAKAQLLVIVVRKPV